ncbi:MAG: transglutaminase-like cysteine peptidase [Parvibaculum sp.]|nr:transglutaminase-like cysteine peptidase [Parvibaculum sp.]
MTRHDIPKIGKWEDDDAGPKCPPWVGFSILAFGSLSFWALIIYLVWQLAKKITVIVTIAALAGCATGAIPAPVTNSAAAVMPPFGYVAMCVANSATDMCSGGTDSPRVITLNATSFAALDEVNRYGNLLPERDDEAAFGRSEVWVEPGEDGGDCEDIAMFKRRALIKKGFPVESLLLAVARDWTGDGHAVLIASTDKGAFVLDNKNAMVVPIAESPYLFLKMQSARRPFVWVDMTGAAGVASELPPVGQAPFVAGLQ